MDNAAVSCAEMKERIAKKIVELRHSHGWTQNQLAEQVDIYLSKTDEERTKTTSSGTISKLESGDKEFSSKWLDILSAIYKISVAELINQKDLPAQDADMPLSKFLPGATTQPTEPRDVPVMAVAAGSAAGSFKMYDDPIDYVRRPSALASVRDAYAIYVGGNSMEPLHRPGDLLFIHPHRHPRRGDSVLIVQNTGSTEADCWIKLFVERTPEVYICEQINPPATIEYPAGTVNNIHKVMNVSDLYGA